MMQATGIVFTAKTKPLAGTTANGTFAITMLVYDRLAQHTTTPWYITYSGPQAKAFWDHAKDKLQTAGQPLIVHVERIQAHSPGRFVAPEVHAIATHIALAPRAHEVNKTDGNPAQTVGEKLSNLQQPERTTTP